MEVSIIIPVYNGEKYINRCLDSVLKQTYGDFEVIIIDDGSTDKSGDICEEFAGKDNRVKVIHKKNEGLIRARITGIETARCEMIAFVDADDWMETDFIESLVKNILQYDVDVVISGCVQEWKNDSKIMQNQIPPGTYYKEEMIKQIYPKMLHYQGFYEFGVLPYMWNKLFKRGMLSECYKNINTDIYDGEDAAVIYPYMLMANKIRVISDAKYHYCRHRQSMTAHKGNDFYENVANLYLHLKSFFRETKYFEIMIPQLNRYMQMMIYQGNPAGFIESEKYIFPFHKVPQGSRIILYGAGLVGKTYYHQIMLMNCYEIVLWVDQNYHTEEMLYLGVRRPEEMRNKDFDRVIIAVADKEVRCLIKNYLIQIGIMENEIL